MPSKLEDLLLRCHQSNGKVRGTLFEYLDDGVSLHALRQCSRPLKDIIGHEASQLWRNLYIHCPLRSNDIVPTFEQGVEFCEHLTISIGFDKTATNRRASRIKRASQMFKHFPGAQKLFNHRKKPTGKRSNANNVIPQSTLLHSKKQTAALYPHLVELPSKDHIAIERLMWQSIIRNFTNTTTLTLRTNGHPAWRGKDEPESTLLLLRFCLENGDLPNIRHLNLHPIHGMGVLHLRWGAFGAFSGVPNHTGLQFWQGIRSLSLHLRNPAAQEGQIYGQQYITFLKILNDYLRSFSRNLQNFKFVWLDREGPNPLALDLEPDMEKQTRLQWPILEEFWFGNVDFPNKTLASIPERAPGVNVVKVLRSTHLHANIDAADEAAWMTISQQRLESEQEAKSSVYSQSESGTPRAFERKQDVAESSSNFDGAEVYDPENYPPVDLATRRGRLYPLVDRRMLATSSVYPESQVGPSEYDPESIAFSLHDIDEDEVDSPEQYQPVRRGRANALVDRRMLATSSVYPQSQIGESEWGSTMIPSTLEPIDELRPAPLNLSRKQDADIWLDEESDAQEVVRR